MAHLEGSTHRCFSGDCEVVHPINRAGVRITRILVKIRWRVERGLSSHIKKGVDQTLAGGLRDVFRHNIVKFEVIRSIHSS